jgi:thiol-disulfide isomerase/thioredoxin
MDPMTKRAIVLVGLAAGVLLAVVLGLSLLRPEMMRFGPTTPAPAALKADALPQGFVPMDPPLQMGGYKFQDADGKAVSLADFKGRPVLLNIWAKWCAPCLEEMPKLDKLQAGVAPGTLAVVAVAVDEKDPAKVRDFLANRRWDALKPYLDPKNVFADALKIKAIPVSLLIDQQGYALARVDAPVNWYSDEAIRLLKQTILTQ